MILLFFLYTFLFAQPAQADIAYPTTTTVQFQNNGQPVTSPVDFTTTCYGYRYQPGTDPNHAPGSYTEDSVYSKSNHCATYGCTIDDSYYLNYRHVDFCSVIGSTDGKNFTIGNIGNKPYGSCKNSNTTNDVSCQSTFDISNLLTTSSQSPLQSFWFAWLATVVIETIMLLVCMKLVFRKSAKGITWYSLILIGVILSTTTLPYVWYVIPNLLLGETFAVLFEAVLLKKFTKLSWFAVIVTSLICNVTSYFVGLALMSWR